MNKKILAHNQRIKDIWNNTIKSEFIFIFILFLIASTAAISGVSSSYNLTSKLDFGLTDNAISSNYTSRVISGFEAIGNYSSSTYTGRFGVLTEAVQPDNIPLINSTDGSDQTAQDLHCSATITEINAKAMNISIIWYNGTTEYLSVDFNNSYSNGTFFVADLLSGNTTRNELWSCSLRIFNGVTYSDWMNSSNDLTILNTPPTVTLDFPTDGALITNTTSNFNWSSSDDDEDSLTYDFNISLVASSLCTDPNQFVQDISTLNHQVSELNCYFDNGDYYVWSVRANDGFVLGDFASSFKINISAFVAISFPTSSVSFGSIPFLGSNNTTNNSPPPFVVQNDGNSLVNLNISATDLWSAVANPTPNYRLKVDNVSGEEGAFNWTASSIGWVAAPANNNSIIIYELNYIDAFDSAELDIYVQVPTNETPAVKSSIVTFISSFAE